MRLPAFGTLSAPTVLTLLVATTLTACGGRSTGVPNDDDPSSMRAEGEGEEDPTGANGSQTMMESSGSSTSSGMTAAGTGSSAGVILPDGTTDPVGGTQVMNDDGSTTTVQTEPDGTVITTTTLPDGSVTSTIVAPDGSVIGTAGSGGAAGVAGVAIGGPVGRPPILIGPMGPVAGGTTGEPLTACVPEYQGTGPDSCEIGLACENGYAWSSCWRDTTGWACDCQANGGYASIAISDVDTDDPCSYSVDVCASGLDLSNASDPQCTPTYQEEGDNYCSYEAECRSSLETEDGVDLQVRQYESVWCENYDAGDWNCGCNQGNSSYNISLQHDDSGVCTTVRDICSSGPIVPEGGYDCERSYMSASTTWCDASLECGQTAVVDGTTIQVNGYANVNCQPDADGVWQCYCSGLGTEVSFEVSSEDEWDTCNDASAQCAEMISGQ